MTRITVGADLLPACGKLIVPWSKLLHPKHCSLLARASEQQAGASLRGMHDSGTLESEQPLQMGEGPRLQEVAHLEGFGEVVLLVHVHGLDGLAEAEDHGVILVLWLPLPEDLHSIHAAEPCAHPTCRQWRVHNVCMWQPEFRETERNAGGLGREVSRIPVKSEEQSPSGIGNMSCSTGREAQRTTPRPSSRWSGSRTR